LLSDKIERAASNVARVASQSANTFSADSYSAGELVELLDVSLVRPCLGFSRGCTSAFVNPRVRKASEEILAPLAHELFYGSRSGDIGRHV
jgi:hypothetical protein